VGKATPDERPVLLEQAKAFADKVKAAEAEQGRGRNGFSRQRTWRSPT